ncbi:hypothetical protein PCANC_19372 [Puccinia coronata f. sp. avenae]|uniref:Uncharacterized protein n=1 Tax=Puccinia coronata f. sp. avenae TaxID=200324 RepID=A0A2N5UPH4_9BASI|nr:hypothetical protein PCANC_19372 [Puccinia coronata f. sp. avenae]
MMKRYGLGARQQMARQARRFSVPDHLRYSTLEKADHREILASIEGGLKSGPAEPMPEDAKGQAVSAVRRIGMVLKAMLYGGVSVGLAATVGFFGVHLWVEFLELPPTGHRGRADDYGWDDQVEGWGGSHLGKGTDPRLGWRIRALIRSAWVAEHWQAGQVALDPDQAAPHAPDGQLVDSAYAMSEARLQQAIAMAQQAGFKLPDRTLFELQLRLASICERLNTPSSLIKSYEIYAQLWKSCVHSTDGVSPSHTNSTDGWRARQAIRIADMLGQVGLKIAALERTVDASRAAVRQQAAENYLIWAITRGLGLQSSLEHPAGGSQATVPSKQSKQPSVWASIFGKLDRQTRNASDSLGHLEPITHQLDLLPGLPHPSALESKPAQLRVVISSLINLSVHLVSVDIRKALVIQNQIHDFVNAAIDVQESQGSESPDAKLHLQWLKSRAALSLVYLSEIVQAVQQTTDQSIVDRCQNALDMIDSTLSTLEEESKGASDAFQRGMTRAFSGRLSEPLERLQRDARLTGAMGASLLGLVHETCPSKRSLASSSHLESTFKWCYASDSQAETGCELARNFFQRAVHYSLGNPASQFRHPQPAAVLLTPLNENLAHLAHIDHLSHHS